LLLRLAILFQVPVTGCLNPDPLLAFATFSARC
jgi:hypothetical protein